MGAACFFVSKPSSICLIWIENNLLVFDWSGECHCSSKMLP